MTTPPKAIWTTTTEGVIRSITVNGITCPVKIAPNHKTKRGIVSADPRRPPKPRKTADGKLVYALPGGYNFSNGEIWKDGD